MRIAYCYPEVLPARAARSVQVVNTCFSLAEQARELILYVPQGGHDGDEIFSYYGLVKPSNLRVCFLRKTFGPLSSHKIYNFFLRLALKNNESDIFFTRHLQTADFLADLSLPFLFEAHEIFAEKKNAATADKLLEKKVFENAAGLLFISKGLKDALEEKYGLPVKWKIIPSSAKRINKLTDKFFFDGQLYSFVYIGTTRYGWKGVDVLIKALELLPTKYSLEIVGDLDKKFAEQERVVKLISQGRLISSGYIQSSKVFALMKKAQVAVIPNSAEDRISACFTSPLKLIEALAAGVAVVVSDLPSMREIVTEKEVLFVRPDDAPSLAEGIRLLLEDEQMRKQFAVNGWYRSREYTWQRRAEKIIKLAREVTGEAAGRNNDD